MNGKIGDLKQVLLETSICVCWCLKLLSVAELTSLLSGDVRPRLQVCIVPAECSADLEISNLALKYIVGKGTGGPWEDMRWWTEQRLTAFVVPPDRDRRHHSV